jgi:phenylpropionate dioxygenase-like ring-hydroxylating dioxygenase large terminal subunit/AcrR family transcriptional regulator
MGSPDQATTLQPSLPGKEPRDARRRRELIEATIESIARHGLSRTTIAKVAEIAGLSAGIVSFYFQTKSALLLATLEHVDGEFGRRQLQAFERVGDDPVRRLEAMIEVDFDPDVSSPSRIAVWNAFWGEARAREDYKRVCGAREAAEEHEVVALFERIADAGGYTHLDPAALGSAFYHLLSSLPETMLEEDEPFDFEGAKATCRAFLASVFPAEFAAAPAKTTPRRELAVVVPEAEPELGRLPVWTYRDPEFYELERRILFGRQWLLMGHTSHVPEPGDFMTLDAAGERALAIRGGDGALRAFHNVCQHRASRVVRGDSGSCSGAIVCPYHGWSYGFDGALRGVPREEAFRDLDRSRLGLSALELEEWQGFVFVRFGGDGPSVAESMRPFEAEARQYRLAEMKPWAEFASMTCAFNWKLFAENDSEGYHIPMGHPGLRRLFGKSYSDEAGSGEGSRAFSVLQEKESPRWSERAYQLLLPVVDHLPAGLRRAWTYYGLFPSAVLQVSPDLVDCYQVLPDGPDRCRIRSFAVALADDRREMRAARYLTSRIAREVARQDLDFCRWTDEGIRSSGYRGGALSDLESGVRQLHREIHRLIPVSRCPEAPPRGSVAASNDEMTNQEKPCRMK